MGKINKTRVTYTAGLPGGAATVTLFDSVAAFGLNGFHQVAEHNWIDLAISCDQNVTGNSVRVQYSNDGAVWNTVFTSAANTPTAGAQFSIEVWVGSFSNVRVQFLNGTNAQTTFLVNLVLDAAERSTANHASALLDT